MLLEQIARGLMLPEGLVQKVALTANHRYKEFRIKKRDGSPRTIHHPSRPLKAIQRWLLVHVVEHLPVHAAAFAYRKGKNIRQHASLHLKSRYLLRMDIEDFFPSISQADLRAFLKGSRPGVREVVQHWTSPDMEIFLRLVCRNGRLTMGAPTSPGLSNAIMWEVDQSLDNVAAEVGATYTRYADDIFFSTSTPNVMFAVESRIRDVIEKASMPKGLTIKQRKTRHSSKKRQRRVTGITLSTKDKVSLGRKMKRNVKRMLHQYGALSRPEQSTLAGILAYVKSIEPDFLNSLVLKYGVTVDKAMTQ